ncbi:hypothetical protein XF_2736 [Xylella fastidiosa 9a5c]|uniref:Uncharacterized protein n=1 Tax=Xylella fastidiosa (strain 9a5c) TaxID=160492 RepID=Q9P9Y4_XYLFA|nr:hypothetical protein XF_2736 [Xylella fastidiosa 9a5c]
MRWGNAPPSITTPPPPFLVSAPLRVPCTWRAAVLRLPAMSSMSSMSWLVRFGAARSSVGTCADCFTAAHVASVVHQPRVRVPISLLNIW